MPKAVWNGAVLAESESLILLEGYYYFPPESVNKAYLRESDMHTTCPWKGRASYYHVVVNDEMIKDGAWYYPEPKEAANQIKGRIAFWKGIRIE